MTMPERKPSWWWDWSWNPVSGCIPVSEGCRDCWSLAWLKCHTWKKPTVYTGAIKEAVDGSIRWTGNLTALRAGDKYWDLPHTHPGVVNPALGDGKPNLIFTVVEGDLFVTGRPKEDIDRVCGTLAASEHIGQLCTKYTSQIVDYFTSLDPDAVRRWQPKIWLGFSAETQKWFRPAMGRRACTGRGRLVCVRRTLTTARAGDATARLPCIGKADMGHRLR